MAGNHAEHIVGLYALKLYVAGLFEQLPKLKILFGNMDDMLPMNDAGPGRETVILLREGSYSQIQSFFKYYSTSRVEMQFSVTEDRPQFTSQPLAVL
jgi:hypothetical protein